MSDEELGPTYGVPLLDCLPLYYGQPKGMSQAMPSRKDLENAKTVGAGCRLTAGYEVLLNHYYKQEAEIQRLRGLTNFLADSVAQLTGGEVAVALSKAERFVEADMAAEMKGSDDG